MSCPKVLIAQDGESKQEGNEALNRPIARKILHMCVQEFLSGYLPSFDIQDSSVNITNIAHAS